MRKLVAAVVLTVGLLAATVTPASAHSFGAQGPAHEHATGNGACSGTNCYRWILFNGVIRQGNELQLVLERDFVLVLCSDKVNNSAPFNEGWAFYPYTFGPTTNRGTTHPYCHSPKYPTAGGLAGWAVNT